MSRVACVDGTGIEHLILGRGDKLPFEETQYKACNNENIDGSNMHIGDSLCSKCEPLIERERRWKMKREI